MKGLELIKEKNKAKREQDTVSYTGQYLDMVA